MARFFIDTKRGLLPEQPPNELSVSFQDFFSPRNSILHALPTRMTMQPKFQILRGVIQSIPIFMMYTFMPFQRTPQHLLHNTTVLHDPLSWPYTYQCIAVPVHHSLAGNFKSLWLSFSSPGICQRISIAKSFLVVCIAIDPNMTRLGASINGTGVVRDINMLYGREQFSLSMPTVMSLAPSPRINIGSAAFNRTQCIHSRGIFVVGRLISYRRNYPCFQILLIVATTIATAMTRGSAIFYNALTLGCSWYSVHTVRVPFLSSCLGVLTTPPGQYIITPQLYHKSAPQATSHLFFSLFISSQQEARHEVLA